MGIAKFKAPITEDGAKYLGLAKADAFTLKDVKAPYVLVEQFNTSCPHCMAQAPVMNALFAKVQADPQLKDKLKFVGAGQGNEAAPVKDVEGLSQGALPPGARSRQLLRQGLEFYPLPGHRHPG